MNRDQSQRVSGSVPSERLDLYSFRYLEFLLGFSRLQLRELSNQAARHYRPFYKEPKVRPFARKPITKKKRLIDNPKGMLKKVQRRINQRLLKPLILPEHLLGGYPASAFVTMLTYILDHPVSSRWTSRSFSLRSHRFRFIAFGAFA